MLRVGRTCCVQAKAGDKFLDDFLYCPVFSKQIQRRLLGFNSLLEIAFPCLRGRQRVKVLGISVDAYRLECKTYRLFAVMNFCVGTGSQ